MNRLGPTISQIGEFALLKKISRWCGSTEQGSASQKKNQNWMVQVPLGDDAFVVKLSTFLSLVISTDALVEGTHFNFTWLNQRLNNQKKLWTSLGYKAMAVNLSDLAAMGNVQPLFSFITFGLPGDISVDSVDNLYTGITQLTKKHHFIIAGGDIIRSEKSIISITIVGQMASSHFITRKGANVGDLLMVSGPLGVSSAGLKILKQGRKLLNSYSNSLIHAHLFPYPRMEEGKILADKDIMATSLMDTSDDLMSSLEILSEKSQVGFELRLDSIPIHSALLKAAKAFKMSPYAFILYGGEDYQLLFTLSPTKLERVKKRIPSAYVLGIVKPKSFGIRVLMNSQPFHLKDSRFKHF